MDNIFVKLAEKRGSRINERDYPLLYWNEASLILASMSRVSKASYLAKDSFIFKIGDLHKDDLKKVDELFIEYNESNQ